MAQTLVFFIFALITIGAALMMISTRNVFRSALLFMTVLLGLSAFYFILQAGFVAVMQILIYAGAVVILTLFVIMLTENISEVEIKRSTHRSGLILLLSLFIMGFFISIVVQFPFREAGEVFENQLFKIGELFLTKFALPFEITSVLLLSALIGAIVIARKEKIAQTGRTPRLRFPPKTI